MGFDISQLKTDPDLELNGTVVKMPEGYWIKVARMNNPRYTDYLGKLIRPYKSQLQRGANSAIRDALIKKAMAKYVLLDWGGIEDSSGQPILYSVEKAEELLTQYTEFYELVLGSAADLDLFKVEQKEEDLGN